MTLLELPPVALPLLWHYGLPVAPHLGFFPRWVTVWGLRTCYMAGMMLARLADAMVSTGDRHAPGEECLPLLG